ncbi:hypothetical protein AB0D56_10345 [Streptomyces sp. NPDC048209]|jgi:hypothetical protein|uniref:hypothetical protein n=1 Tax=Streptomyces sp. NPDC048209 TaxID=3156689 RepID=UPI003434C3AC
MCRAPEFNPGGILVPTGPVYVSRQELEPVLRPDVAVEMFIQHMAAQDPERLEQDRAEAWGDGLSRSPDAMTVTFDRGE